MKLIASCLVFMMSLATCADVDDVMLIEADILSGKKSYQLETEVVLNKCDLVRELVKRYPNISSISYFTTKKSKLWNTAVLLHERYELKIQFSYEINGDEIVISKDKFIAVINEYKRIKNLDDGRVSVKYGSSVKLSYDEFNNEFNSGYDFNSLKLNKSPIDGALNYFNNKQGERYVDGGLQDAK